MLVLGLGNAAFETATRASETAAYVHLLGRSRGGLKLASRTHYVGDVRAVNLGSASCYILPRYNMSSRPRPPRVPVSKTTCADG